MNHASATQRLARFARALDIEDIPAEVREKVLLHALDQIGAALAGSTQPWNATVREYALAESPAGPCTVIGAEDARVRPEWAALANATAGHGVEIDDYHPAALSHPGCVAVPTVLAVGEDAGTRGQEAIVALSIAFETIVRLGLAVQPSLLYDRGFHETCTEGVFGAALAAGRLRDLPADELASALGIAGSHASGTTEYTQSGGEVKRLHAGLGAMGGIRAVSLARRGFSGPATILEGSRGFLQAFAATADGDRLVDGLGDDWALLDCAIKPYFCCGLIHAPIAALEKLMAEHQLRADGIEEIVVGADHLSLMHVGKIGPRPLDMTGAQFSMEFSLGMTLALGGNDFGHYVRAAADGFSTPEVLAVAECVRLTLDEEADAAFPDDFFARLTVRTTDGRQLQNSAYAPGSPREPRDEADIRRKFRGIVEPLLGVDRARRVERAVDALADDGPVAAIGDALRAPVAVPS